MAVKITKHFIDDLDGSSDGVRTITFAYEGQNYSIDLSEDNQVRLRAALEPFIENGTKVAASNRHAQKKSSAAYDVSKLRVWAQQNGYEVPTRRPKKELIAAYLDAQKA